MFVAICPFFRVALLKFLSLVFFCFPLPAAAVIGPASNIPGTVEIEDWTSASVLARSRTGSLQTEDLWWYVFFTREATPESVEKFAHARQLPTMLQSDCVEYRKQIVPMLRRVAGIKDSFSDWAETAPVDELQAVEKRALRLGVKRAFEKWQANALAEIALGNSVNEITSTTPKTALKTPETRTVQYILIPRTQLIDDAETSAKVAMILAKLKDGENMGELAREYSAASTARIGGIRDHITSESLPEGTAAAIFAADVAAPPAVVETDYAYFIFRVLSTAKMEGARESGQSIRQQQAAAQNTDRTMAQDASRLQIKHEVKLSLPDRAASDTVIVRWPEGELLGADVAEMFPELWELDRAEAADQAACAAAAWEELLENRGEVQRAVDMASAVALGDYLATREITTAQLEALYATLLQGDDLHETTETRTWRCRVVVDLPTTATAGDIYYLRQEQPDVALALAKSLSDLPVKERAEKAAELSLPANFRVDVEDLGFRAGVQGVSQEDVESQAVTKPRQESGQAFAMYWVSEIRPSRVLSFDEARPRLEQLARQAPKSETTGTVRITSGLFPCGLVEEIALEPQLGESILSDDGEETTGTEPIMSITSGNLEMKVRSGPRGR